MSSDEPPEIVIVGAGVIGLSLALAIIESSTRCYQITIVAEHLPDSQPYLSQYTSPWAGAHFRPFPLKNEAELREYPWTRETWKRMKRFAAEAPESSVKIVQGIDLIEENELYEKLGEGYSEGLDNFKVISREKLPPGFSFGALYDTFVLNAPHYIQFLHQKLKNEYGATFVKKRLERLKDAASFTTRPDPVIVNCTGNGLLWDGGTDPACFPIRGQTLLVNSPQDSSLANKTVTIQHKLGDWTFCINRPLNGGTIIGGTKQVNDWSSSIKEADSEAIKARAEKYFPQLMQKGENGKPYFDVIRTNVGFRPARIGGVNISVHEKDKCTVINAYGTAGSGYELSYGIGLQVFDRVAVTHLFGKL